MSTRPDQSLSSYYGGYYYSSLGDDYISVNTDLACQGIEEAKQSKCNSTAYIGTTCALKVDQNHTVVTSLAGSVQYSAEQTFLCKNETDFQFCPLGKFCPSQYVLHNCPVGSFCYTGSSKPSKCLFGSTTCPATGMGEIDNTSAYFSTVFLIFTCLFVYRYISKKLIFWDELRYGKENKMQSNKGRQKIDEMSKYSRSLAFLNLKRTTDETNRISANASEGANAAEAAAGAKPRLSAVPPPNPTPSSSGKLKKIIRSKKFKDYVSNQKLLSQTFTTDLYGDFSFREVAKPLTISFNNLNLNLKHSGAPILHKVFGTFRPFNITALMGSSGAGKTTLLSLLRGQAHFATTSGDIFVNGSAVESLIPYQSKMAFVPQDDIVYDELSVKDNILYSAMLFNKRGYKTEAECLPMVIYVMNLVGLTFIAHSVVGSAENKGISGGQKKRVSVAMELIKEPDFFLLDEPTSGLDSATSISLLHSLHHISANGVNVVATLHQPRKEILDMINSICLLAPGGRVIFFGAPFELRLRFSKLGYEVPGDANIADFAMDCIAGFNRPRWMDGDSSGSTFNAAEAVRKMYEYYDEADYPKFKQQLDVILETADGTVTFADTSGQRQPSIRDIALTLGLIPYLDKKAGQFHDGRFITTLYVAYRRQVKSTHRTFGGIIFTCFILMIMGALISKVFGKMQLDADVTANSSVTGTFIQQTISAQLAYSLIVVNASLKLFLGDSQMRLREETGGVQLTPLFLGKIAASVIDLSAYSLSFLSGYYPFIGAQGSFVEYWGVYFLLHLAISGEANLLAIALPGRYTSLLASGILIVLWSSGGVAPPTLIFRDRMGGLGKFLNAVSPFSASFRLQFFIEFTKYAPAWDAVIEKYYNAFHYFPRQQPSAFATLFGHWLACNFVAYLTLLLRRDNWKTVRDVSNWSGLAALYNQLLSVWSDVRPHLKAVYKDLSDREMQLTASILKSLERKAFVSTATAPAASFLAGTGGASPAVTKHAISSIESALYDSCYERKSIRKENFSIQSPLHIEISK